jgi:hypothetical protein
MPKLVCRQCKYSVVVTEKQAKFGMMCPECYCGNMRRVEKPRPGSSKNRVVHLRPNTIRMLIGGVILFGIGAAMTVFGMANWNQGRFGARMTAYGIVIGGAGCISLLGGLFNVIKDMRD